VSRNDIEQGILQAVADEEMSLFLLDGIKMEHQARRHINGAHLGSGSNVEDSNCG